MTKPFSTRRKSWREKLDRLQEPRVVEPGSGGRRQSGRLLIPTPRQVDGVVRRVPHGHLITPAQIRDILARRHDADSTCPLCTGIFLRISAEAAAEDEQEGRSPITPFWRVVGADGSLNPKLPGGAGEQARRLEAEGHQVEPGAGKKPPWVRGFERELADL